MELMICDEVRRMYPNLKAAVMEARFGEAPEFSRQLSEHKQVLESEIRESCRQPEELERVRLYNEFYRKFGSKVPMEFQIKSVLNGKEIPRINAIVSCMFMAELKNVVLTAGHDLDMMGEKIEVMLSQGEEEYTNISGKVQNLKKGDVYASDCGKIVSSVLYGPDSDTRISEKTKKCLFMCYSFGLKGEELKAHLEDIKGYLRLAGGRAWFGETNVAGE